MRFSLSSKIIVLSFLRFSQLAVADSFYRGVGSTGDQVSVAVKNIKPPSICPTSTIRCIGKEIEISDNDEPLSMSNIDAPCVSTAEAGETQILLSDGKYYGLGVRCAIPTAEEIQEELAEVEKQALTEERIVELQQNGLLR
ncbi:hypothetical protein F5884DRAFT_801827 [Xylogone sp. PMI_703]|nr:hypothetical protein F5884DRAFT_801827 [Xylogone sp. PMI_703]